MTTLNERQKQIIKIIQRSKTSITSEYLGALLAVSSKTIKNEILDANKIINIYDTQIISKPGVGYTLSTKTSSSFNNIIDDFPEMKSELPINIQRAHYIIRKLLSSKLKVMISSLSEDLFVSRTTISNDLIMVKKLLSEYNITLTSKAHHGLIVNGSEHAFRQCLLSEKNFHSNKTLEIDEEEYESLFQLDQAMIKQLEDIFYDVQLEFSTVDIPYHSISLIINLTILSINWPFIDHHDSYSNAQISHLNEAVVLPIINEYVDRIEKLFAISFTQADKYILTITLSCFRTYTSIDQFRDKNFYYKHYEISRQIIDAIAEINQFKRITSDITLRTDLALHLIELFKRAEFGIINNNLYIPDVIRNSPSATELAAQTTKIINERYDFNIFDSEVVMLVYTFYPTFGRINYSGDKKDIIIVSSINKIHASGLAERLERNFGALINSIKLAEIYELTNYNFGNYDLIFTDVPLVNFPETPIPVYYLDIFFSQEDKKHIKNILALGKVNPQLLTRLFRNDLFFQNVSLDSKEEYFQFISRKISQDQLEVVSISKQLSERERILSGEIGNQCVILKPLMSVSKESFISITILDKPIVWKNETVQVIVLWNIGLNDYEASKYFEEGYLGNCLKSIFSNQQHIASLLIDPRFSTVSHLLKERFDSYLVQK